MIRLSVAIMAHPSRMDHVEGMLEKLSPYTDVHVEIDHQELGPWPTAKKCWEATPEDASHRLILQDDVLLCKDFYVGACKVLRHRPASPVAFYVNDKKIEEAREAGKSWTRIHGFWGQAQCLPAAYIPHLLRFASVQSKPKHDPKCDDWMLTAFCKQAKLKVWATVPSLVDHAGASRSLIGFSNKSKVARWFLGEDVSALSVDWRVKHS